MATVNNAANLSITESVEVSDNCDTSDSINQTYTKNHNCLPSISSSPVITQNRILPPQERFLSAVTPRLSPVPIPQTFEYILLRQYGSPFINSNNQVNLPGKVIFSNAQETQAFQSTLIKGKVNSGNACVLQKSAADAFNAANQQVRIPLKSGNGGGDCTRTYQTTLRFWRKYANDRTLELVRQGKETRILAVVAPPGSSQHLWGLAIDLRVSKQSQRRALNEHGWFQTVENDTPHWTYVGVAEAKLPEFGLRKKLVRGVTYWLTPI
uniref:D-alanyl-D-alanine carboxypeptidase family protein n=1 Tax=Calothrix sp. PCC 6303 TaxID=1170562 RepID=UPI001EEFABE0|nr:D-alanyl-D-alanine carboxypeptidase family protein [Calothrix sp. PCC 6303]